MIESPLASPELWRLPLQERMAVFAELREEGPFHPVEFENPMTQSVERFYAVTRFDEVMEISRRPKDSGDVVPDGVLDELGLDLDASAAAECIRGAAGVAQSLALARTRDHRLQWFAALASSEEAHQREGPGGLPGSVAVPVGGHGDESVVLVLADDRLPLRWRDHLAVVGTETGDAGGSQDVLEHLGASLSSSRVIGRPVGPH